MDSNWLSFKEMLDDIKIYLESNADSTIVQNDRPFKLTIGYSCEKSGKEWNIGIANLKKLASDSSSEFFVKSLQTQEGKNNLLKVINSWSKKS